MTPSHFAFALAMITLAALLLGMAAFTVQRSPSKGSGSFALMLLAMALGALAYGLELLSADLEARIFWMRIGYLAHPLIAPLWFYFTLRFSGQLREQRADLALAIFLLPVSSVLLAWTNDYHGLFFGEMTLTESTFGQWLLVPKEALYYLYAGYSSLLLIGGLLLAARKLAATPHLQVFQALLLILAGLLPLIAGALFIFQQISPLEGLNLTPLLMGLCSPVWLWALFRYRLFDVLPLAEGWVIRNLPEGVVVLNRDGLVLEMNDAAESALGISLTDAFGEAALRLLPGSPLSLPLGQAVATHLLEFEQPRRYVEARISPLMNARQKLVGRIMTLRGVTDRQLAIETERRARALHEALHNSALAISSSLELDAVLDAILDNLGQVIPHDGASIMLLKGDELRFVRVRGHEQQQEILSTPWKLAAMPNYLQMCKNNEPFVISDARKDPRWKPVRSDSAWIASWASAPILQGDRVIGFLNLDSASPGYYDESVKQPLLSFADLAGVALANAQTYEDDHRARTLAEALHDSALAISSSLELEAVLDAILDNLGRALPHDAASIMLLADDELRFARSRGHDRHENFDTIQSAYWAVSQLPTYVEMIRSREPLVISDVSTDPRWNHLESGANWIKSWASAPILHGVRVIGFLNLDSARRNDYDQSVLGPLRSFADLAGVALANAQLYQAEQRAREEIEVLQRLSLHIAGQIKTDHTLHAIAESSRQLLAADSTAIYLVDSRQEQLVEQLVVATALGEHVPQVGQGLDLGQGLAGRVWAEKRPISVYDYQQWDGRVNRSHTAHLRSAVAVPIVWRDHPIGVITVAASEKRIFTAQETRLLTLLAAKAATALQNARLVDKLERTVTEMVRRNDELDSFSYNVAHDLRVPLGTITGYVEFARMELAGELSEGMLNILDQLNQAATRMNEIIEGLMVLARLNSEAVELRRIDLAALIRQIALEQALLIEERHIELSIEAMPELMGYEPWLRLVFSNLINNAIKYIGALNQSPMIRIRGREEDHWLRYEVEDNGVGIPEKVRGRVFDRFTRFSSQEAAGLGLGLSIVYRIVTRMQGEVLVEPAPEKGSIFIVRLPRNPGTLA